jgi:hypothetical protein
MDVYPLILEEYTNPNWRWRMAARKMMERETVLSLESIRKLFNRFFRNGQKFFREVLAAWLVHPDAKRRLFGISANRFNTLSATDRTAALDGAWDRMQDRFEAIFQRRHDCIHNCDRPRVSPQPLRACEIVSNAVEDINFLVQRCNAHINSEFRQFLIDCGCPAAIVTQAGY